MKKQELAFYVGLLVATGYIGLGLYLKIAFKYSLIAIISGIIFSRLIQFAIQNNEVKEQ